MTGSKIHTIADNAIKRILLKDEAEIRIFSLSLDFRGSHIGIFKTHYKHLFGEANYQNVMIRVSLAQAKMPIPEL